MSKAIALTLAVCLVFGQVTAAISPYIFAYSDSTCDTYLSGPYELTESDYADVDIGSI
jgi:hypothetical protein